MLRGTVLGLQSVVFCVDRRTNMLKTKREEAYNDTRGHGHVKGDTSGKKINKTGKKINKTE